MVTWSDYYRFSEDCVEAIGTADNTGGTHPYVLTVYLKSGNKMSVSYADKQSRRAAMLNLSRQIDSGKRNAAEEVRGTLYQLQVSINRIDKRQLRIWQQLRALLGIKAEVEEDGK